MIFALLLTTSLFRITLMPPENAFWVFLAVECENGWGRESLMELEGKKSLRLEMIARAGGECFVDARALDRKGKVLKRDTRTLFTLPD